MTRVCLLGSPDVTLRYELFSRETARDALQTYDIREPYRNTVAVETVSLGAAVSLLNDLDWYLARFADAAFVLEPSISDEEWLSRALATAVRDDEVEASETDHLLRIYGLVEPEDGEGAPELVEPMHAARTGGSVPTYDLRDVDETLRVRVTEDEFGS